MKLCPKCELNYIADNADLCDSCAQQAKKRQVCAHGSISMSQSDDEKLLRQMGVAWFVSYSWYNIVDRNHRNWQTVDTNWRIPAFNRTRQEHINWLKQIIQKSEKKLNNNNLGLSGHEIISMAKKLLQSK